MPCRIMTIMMMVKIEPTLFTFLESVFLALSFHSFDWLLFVCCFVVRSWDPEKLFPLPNPGCRNIDKSNWVGGGGWLPSLSFILLLSTWFSPLSHLFSSFSLPSSLILLLFFLCVCVFKTTLRICLKINEITKELSEWARVSRYKSVEKEFGCWLGS